jgi:hypothetical protein
MLYDAPLKYMDHIESSDVAARSGLSRGAELDGCLIAWTYPFMSGQ